MRYGLCQRRTGPPGFLPDAWRSAAIALRLCFAGKVRHIGAGLLARILHAKCGLVIRHIGAGLLARILHVKPGTNHKTWSVPLILSLIFLILTFFVSNKGLQLGTEGRYVVQ